MAAYDTCNSHYALAPIRRPVFVREQGVPGLQPFQAGHRRYRRGFAGGGRRQAGLLWARHPVRQLPAAEAGRCSVPSRWPGPTLRSWPTRSSLPPVPVYLPAAPGRAADQQPRRKGAAPPDTAPQGRRPDRQCRGNGQVRRAVHAPADPDLPAWPNLEKAPARPAAPARPGTRRARTRTSNARRRFAFFEYEALAWRVLGCAQAGPAGGARSWMFAGIFGRKYPAAIRQARAILLRYFIMFIIVIVDSVK